VRLDCGGPVLQQFPVPVEAIKQVIGGGGGGLKLRPTVSLPVTSTDYLLRFNLKFGW
jgi:hypothetical protein